MFCWWRYSIARDLVCNDRKFPVSEAAACVLFVPEFDTHDQNIPANFCMLAPENLTRFLRFSVILCCQLSLLSKVPHLQ
jgi:hypothetical protein